MIKFDKSKDNKEMQPSNILSILVTILVLNKDKSKKFKELQF